MKHEKLNRRVHMVLCSDKSTAEKAEILTTVIAQTGATVLLFALGVGLVVGVTIGLVI